MEPRVLRIAIRDSVGAETAVNQLAELTTQILADHPAVRTPLFTVVSSSQSVSDEHHLVVEVDESTSLSPWVDATAINPEDRHALIADRIAPWAYKWSINRRAPRAMAPVLTASNDDWPSSAARLIGRLQHHITDPDLLRIDHIGSTSVPGLDAKDLVDIQVLVANVACASEVAHQATNAGFSLVAGDWFGIDRYGHTHPELVVVDSDPGRPVNCNIRVADTPVGRDALLYRDWLRANVDARNRYSALKARLVAEQDPHVDRYSEQKEPFINAALIEAEQWAATVNWSPDL